MARRLVGDGGIRGLVLRLQGAFDALEVRAEDGAVLVEAGGSRCGVSSSGWTRTISTSS